MTLEGNRYRGIGGVTYTVKADMGSSGGHIETDDGSGIVRKDMMLHFRAGLDNMGVFYKSQDGREKYDALSEARVQFNQAFFHYFVLDVVTAKVTLQDRNIGADILFTKGVVMIVDGQISRARGELSRSLSIYQEVGDKKGAAAARQHLRSLGEQGLR